jgi:hypothetical protein
MRPYSSDLRVRSCRYLDDGMTARAAQGGGHQAVLPTALLARSEPDRENVRQAQTPARESQRENPRSNMAPGR